MSDQLLEAALRQAKPLLIELGYTELEILVYLALIAKGARTRSNLLKDLRPADSTEIDRTIDRLKSLYLVAEQHTRDSVRIAPTRPRISWRYQLMEIVWRHAPNESIKHIDSLPPLSDDRAQRRRQLLGALSKTLDPFVPPMAYAASGVRRGRGFADPSDYAYACAEAISTANARILACDRPPRMPHLSVFWSAITDRLDNNVQYTRCVSLPEIVSHGLDIVRRDVADLGIDLRVTALNNIARSFYIIDDSYMLAKSYEPGKYGYLSFRPELIERYRQQFAAPALSAAVPAAGVLDALDQWAADTEVHAHRTLGATAAGAFRLIARHGRFAKLDRNQQDQLPAMLRLGILATHHDGSVTIAPPPTGFLGSLA